jgi:hypothetical protein
MIGRTKLESLPPKVVTENTDLTQIESYVATFASGDRYIQDHGLNWMDFG